MSDIVSPLLQWLNDHPHFAGLVTFVISAGESVAIIGTIVPGSIMMTALGALAGAGVIPLWQTIFWAIMGAIVGDGISYWIGHYFKDRLRLIWPFRSHPTLLKTGEKFFHKYGSMSVFIGRFVGPVRALVPVVAGMLGMKPLQFTIANVLSAIGWAPVYMLPGILLGAAALELPPEIAMHVILVFLFIILFIMLCLWFIYKLFQLIRNQLTQLQNKVWAALKKSQYFSAITVILKHHNHRQTHGQFALALLFIFTSLLFWLIVCYVKYKTPIKIMSNDIMFHLFRGLSIRNETLDNFMINVTLLGQKPVILPVAFVVIAYLGYCKRWWTALHGAILVTLAGSSIFIIKHLTMIPRPWGIVNSPETYSMPSGHTVFSTTIYMGLAFLIAYKLKPGKRWPIYTLGLLLAFAVSISRVYLGVHWFSDVVAGWILSIAILLLVFISYQRQKEKKIHPTTIFLISLITICISFSFYHYRNFTQLQKDYAQVSWPTSEIAMADWWQKNGNLPSYRVSLFGYPSQLLNIQWVGNVDQIRDSLFKEGWTRPPARDVISTFHRIADISSTEYLPMISPQYLDKRPALILTRYVNGERNLLVIRLWDSNIIIKDTNTSLWVGTIGIVPRSYSWLFKKRASHITIDPAHVFPTKAAMENWEWKIMDINIPTRRNKTIQQRVMLIRENQSIIHHKNSHRASQNSGRESGNKVRKLAQYSFTR